MQIGSFNAAYQRLGRSSRQWQIAVVASCTSGLAVVGVSAVLDFHCFVLRRRCGASYVTWAGHELDT